MERDGPKLLRQLNDELGSTVHQGKSALGYELFTVDLSAWKLRLSNRTPVIWVKRTDLDDANPQYLMQSLADVLREKNWGRQIVLVLVDGNSHPLLRHRPSPIHNLVLIGAEEQKNVSISLIARLWPAISSTAMMTVLVIIVRLITATRHDWRLTSGGYNAKLLGGYT